MNTSDNASPVQPSRSGLASRVQIGLFKGVWGVGALAVIASVALLIGAFTANTAAGENGQPAAALGLFGLCLGGTLLVVGMLARYVVLKSGRR